MPTAPGEDLVHRDLPGGVELAVDRLPQRATVAMTFRMLTGLVDEPEPLTGIASIVERTLSKGTQRYTGQQLADAFDARGIQWSSASGRQSTLVRTVCLPEFVADTIELVAEMLCRPTFPDDACAVAVELATEELRHMEDEPQDLLRADIQRITLGPRLGRHPGGTLESLPNIDPPAVRRFWATNFHRGRLQVAAAGPVEIESVAPRIEAAFAGLGSPARGGRERADFEFTPTRTHRPRELQQEYIGLTLPGTPKGDPCFATEQVLIGVLSGGMSGRLFTEVREKQGLVYWVAAWHEQPRGAGVIHLGASTTPERCEKTYATLRRELERLAEDLTEAEVARARDQLIAHCETEDDLTGARAAGLSDDLFHFSRPIGLGPKLDALRAVSLDMVCEFAARLPRDRLCVATVGPRELT